MNRLRYLLLLLLLTLPVLSHAGAQGLIMHMPINTMKEHGLIHLELIDEKDSAKSGSQLKEALLYLDNCDAALTPLKLGYDYYYGYYPSSRKVGLVIPPAVWRNHQLCIQLPGYQPLIRSFEEGDIANTLTESLFKIDE